MKFFLILVLLFSFSIFAQEIPGDHLEFHLKDEHIEKVVVKKQKKKKLSVTVLVNDLGTKQISDFALKNPGKEVSVFTRKRFLEKFRLTPNSPKLKAFQSLENWRSQSEVTKVFDNLPTVFIP